MLNGFHTWLISLNDKVFQKTAYQKQAEQYYEREGEGRLQNEIFKC